MKELRRARTYIIIFKKIKDFDFTPKSTRISKQTKLFENDVCFEREQRLRTVGKQRLSKNLLQCYLLADWCTYDWRKIQIATHVISSRGCSFS